MSKLPEFGTLRDEARAIKDHTLNHLDLYLEAYERKVVESGGQVHFAPSAADARDIVLKICKEAGARLVTKGKSMVSEEIGLNAHLESAGIEVAETDLGEHIIQIRGEAPSHIIAPVIHLNKEEIAEDFVRVHRGLAPDRPLGTVPDLVAEARAVLREKFLAADVGITGANLLIAETGSSVIVTNEGNGDLTETLPEGAYRRRLDREDGADARRCLHGLAAARALRHRPGNHHLHHLRHRACARRRP